MMVTAMEIILPAAAGAALGLFYYGGLWLTVRRLHDTTRPATLMLSSYFIRTALSLPVFYLAVRGGQWGRLLILTTAFLAMRMFLVYRLGPRQRTAVMSPTGEQYGNQS